MGNALHRLEVLLVGLVLLIAGAVVAVLLLVRPASPSGYVQITPQPIGTSVAVQPTSAPALAATLATAGAATAIPIPTAAPAATSAPSTVAPTQIASTAAPSGAPARTWSVPPVLIASWPYLLLTVGLGGLALVVGCSIRKRRLPYTNQSVGQLLAAADPVTREANMRVMQNLSKQGLLTRDLAAAAGIHQGGWRRQIQVPQVRIPRPPLPTLRLPSISVPKLSLPRQRLPRRHQRPLTIDCAPAVSTQDLAVEAPVQEPQPVPTPTPIRDLGVASLSDESAPMIDAAVLHEALAAQDVAVPSVELLPSADAHTADHADTWTAEDRVLAVAGVLGEIWTAEKLVSPILALDTATASGNGQVLVTIEQHPDEEERIAELPDRITAQRSTWRASWRQDKLMVEVVTDAARPPAGGPLIVPILAHGRGGKTTRFYPLASWRHLGLYGGQALPALHALLGSLLYNQPPSHVALTILDRGEISPLYRAVAHLVPPPGTAAATLDQLTRILRRPVARDDVRPLLLIVVEPDTALLIALTTLLTRLRQQPSTPLHLLLVQERLLPAGHELYAMLPALITSGGHGTAPWLAGPHAWPRSGTARLVARSLRAEGRPRLLDEAAIATLLAAVRGAPVDLPPVLWDSPIELPIAIALDALAADRDVLVVDADETATDAAALDNASRRIAQRIVIERQRLMDQEDAFGRDHPSCADAALAALDASDTALPQEDAAPLGAAAPVGAAQPAVAPGSDIAPAPAAAATGADPASTAPSTPAGAPDAVDEDEDGSPSWIGELLALDALPRAEQRALLIPARPVPADGPPEPATVAPEPENGWPCGPAPLGRMALAALLTRVVTQDEIIAGDPNNIGVTKNRLISLLPVPKAPAKELAETLLVWFDQAGLLVEPTRPGSRLRHPRPLRTTDLAAIAAQLTATPLPDAATVAAAWDDAANGRS